MRIILLALLALPLAAQQTITNLRLMELEGTTATVRFQVGEAGNNPSWVDFNNTTTLSLRTRAQNASFGSATDRWVQMGGLAPATKYYFSGMADGTVTTPEFACPVTCTNCTSADDPYFYATPTIPINCDAISEPPNFTTTAQEACVVGGAACPPIAPTHAYENFPSVTIDGLSLTVDGGCTNLQAHIDTISAADWSLNHEIVIPAGTVCTPSGQAAPVGGFELKCPTGLNPTGDGWKFIRTDADSRLLPPFNTGSIHPGYKPHMASLRHTTDYVWEGNLGRGNQPSLLRRESGCSPNPVKNWWKIGLYNEMPDADEMPVNQAAVSAVDTGTGIITFGAPHGFLLGQAVWVSLPGINNGVFGCWIFSNFTPTSFSCFGQGGSFSGTYTSGGVATQTAQITLASCTDTTPIQCDSVAADHGYRPSEPQTILSYANSVLTTESDPRSTRLLQEGFSVVMSGAPDAPYNAHHSITASSDATDTITVGTTLSDTCGATCGSVERMLPLVIGGVTGCSTCNGGHSVRIVDNNTIELVGTTAGGVGTGGYIRGISGQYNNMMHFNEDSIFGAGAEGIVCDRCVFDAKDWTRGFFGLVIPNTGALHGTWMQNFNGECEYDPLASFPRSTVCPAGKNPGSGSNAIVGQTGTDWLMRGWTIYNSAGINIFMSDDNSSTRQQPSDQTYERGTVYKSRRFVPGDPASDGFFYAHRHYKESKGSERLAWIGNHVYLSSANSDTEFGAFILSSRGDSTGTFIRHTRDVDVSYNIFRDNNRSFTQISETSGATQFFPTKRVRIEGNLWLMSRFNSGPGGVDEATRLKANPAVNLPHFFGGFPGPWINGITDLTIRLNTILYSQGNEANMMKWSWYRNSRVQVEDNIWGYSKVGGSSDGLYGTGESEGPLPTPSTASNLLAFQGWTRAEPATDPLSFFRNNVILPVIHSPVTGFDAKRLSTDDADTVTADEATADFAGFTGLQFVGATGACTNDCDTAIDRENLLFQPNSWVPNSPTYDNKGADIQTLFDRMGYIQNVAVSQLSATSMRIEYRAPLSGGVCRVDHTSDASFGASYWLNGGSANDNGIGQARTFDLTALTVGLQYRYRIFCDGGRGEVIGLLRTR